MAKRIVNIEIEIPGANAEYASINSKLSLLDYDISIIRPNIRFFVNPVHNYQGKPVLADSDSFQLRQHLEHWKREIVASVKSGKTVLILMDEVQEVCIQKGPSLSLSFEQEFETLTNYSLLPISVEVRNTTGSSMQLADSPSVLASYWKEIGNHSEYRVVISGKDIQPLVKTKNGSRIVGSYVRAANSSGTIVLLPYVDLEKEDFFECDPENNEFVLNDKGAQMGARFLSAVIRLDKALREGSELTPAPAWLEAQEYDLAQEKTIQVEILKLETKLETLQKSKEEKQKALAEEISLKNLLYEKGKPLEYAIRRALDILGFNVSHFHNGDSEFDVVFECPEGRLIGEAEGKDKKAINVDKLRQLDMNIHEDFERAEVKDMAKGALFGNAYRLLPPEKRTCFFTNKCTTAAGRSQTALISCVDLFHVARHVSEEKDLSFAKKCRQAIIAATGLVEFPPIKRRTSKKTNTHLATEE